ncbi:MAG: asparagine synthase (glutamine-hydrolyzing), partial [Blastocatellia bacterium]
RLFRYFRLFRVLFWFPLVCGIAGIYNYAAEEPVDAATLRRMTDVLTHRGPDDEGFYVEGPVGLGHRRLSIIDIAGGRQPIFNEDRTVAIVFNGEIYNYLELRRIVEARGHTLKTKSDTEPIVHLYEDFGESCVTMLRGMFAIALWDARDRKLLLARDRVGKKPLYYADCGGSFTFGSELKAVIENASVPRVIDDQAVADYFSFQYIPAPKTIFRHVRKLRAGHYLVVTPRSINDREYWDIDFSHTERRSEAEWRALLLETFQESVGLRLVGEAPLGAFLSSGVDSSAVAAMMRRVADGPVVTASVGFKGEKHSETPAARGFAEWIGATHHERIVEADVAGVIEKLAWHYDEPFADSSAIPAYYVSHAARQFVTVALSGDGGDENFLGYRRYVFDAFENRVRDYAPTALRKPLFGALATVYPKADWAPRFLRAKATLKNLSLDPAAAYYNSVYGAMANERDRLLGSEARAELKGYDPFEVFLEHYNRPRNAGPMARAQYVDIKTYLTDDILTKVDRASMAVSLEARCPLLDHRLMELAARIPSSLKLRGREGKYIFKRALSTLLPPDVLSRPKQGFVAPVAVWLRKDLREFAGEALFDEAANDGWLDRAAVTRLWKDHQSGRRDYSRPLWAALMFKLWRRNFMKG